MADNKKAAPADKQGGGLLRYDFTGERDRSFGVCADGKYVLYDDVRAVLARAAPSDHQAEWIDRNVVGNPALVQAMKNIAGCGDAQQAEQPAAQPSVPEGCALVPVEASAKMCRAFFLAGHYPEKPFIDGYRAMLAAAPQPREKQSECAECSGRGYHYGHEDRLVCWSCEGTGKQTGQPAEEARSVDADVECQYQDGIHIGTGLPRETCPCGLCAKNRTEGSRGSDERAAATAQAVDLPERDTSKSAEQQGLFRKFDVRRTDGSDAPGEKHHGCRYFVLDVDHDAHASVALGAYASACEVTHPVLARELRDKWGASQAATGAQGLTDEQRQTIARAAAMLEAGDSYHEAGKLRAILAASQPHGGKDADAIALERGLPELSVVTYHTCSYRLKSGRVVWLTPSDFDAAMAASAKGGKEC